MTESKDNLEGAAGILERDIDRRGFLKCTLVTARATPPSQNEPRRSS